MGMGEPWYSDVCIFLHIATCVFVKRRIPSERGAVYQLTYFQQEGAGFKKSLATCSKYWLKPFSLPEHEVAKVYMPHCQGMMVAGAHLAFNYPVPEHSLI